MIKNYNKKNSINFKISKISLKKKQLLTRRTYNIRFEKGFFGIFYSNSLINLEKICIIDIEKESYLKNGRKNVYEKKTSSFNNFGWMGNEPS